MHRLDHADVVDDAGQVRQQVANPRTVLTTSVHGSDRGDNGEAVLPGRHTRHALIAADRGGQFCAVQLPERGRVVEQVDMRRSTRLKKVDDPPSPGRKMGHTGETERHFPVYRRRRTA